MLSDNVLQEKRQSRRTTMEGKIYQCLTAELLLMPLTTSLTEIKSGKVVLGLSIR